MTEATLHHRVKNIQKNGCAPEAKYRRAEKEHATDFAIRESPLTLLLHNSSHIKTIYHIFVVILLMLLLETVVHDFIDGGKINLGQHSVVNGFGDIGRGISLWLYDFAVTLAFYPLLWTYGSIGKQLSHNLEFRRLWSVLGIVGLVLVQVALFAFPVWDLGRKHLELASSISVTCEMFRFSMKIFAVGISCGPRCLGAEQKLPSFSHYLYFLFAPTLVYRDTYPRTKHTRWNIVIRHFGEVVAIVFYNSFLWERFILPHWSDYGTQSKVDAGTLVRSMFACALPGVISFLSGFYCLLHAWSNAFAEMLKFGDRLFYEEWWTTCQFSKYYRAWNRIVHSWLRDYIYQPLAPRLGRVVSTFLVFFVSSVAHEIVLALSFGFFYPVLLMQFGVLGLLMIPLTAGGKYFPNVFNMLMWLSLSIGNGLLWSLYAMEYFARKNCPPSESDSFFIPKSWTCPEVILKPNWSFKNPLELHN